MVILYEEFRVKHISEYVGQEETIYGVPSKSGDYNTGGVLNMLGIDTSTDPDTWKVDRDKLLEFPHLAFIGIGGIGKSNFAELIVSIADCDVRSFNTNRDGNKDFVTWLDSELQYPPKTPIRFIIIEEASELTREAQHALRAILEDKRHSHNRFILTLNYEGKMIPEVMDRCTSYRFYPHKVEDIIKRLNFIADKKDWSEYEDSISEIAKRGNGSMRRAIGLMQIYCVNGVVTAPIDLEKDSLFNIWDAVRKSNIFEAMETYRTFVRYGRHIYDLPVMFMVFVENHGNLSAIDQARVATVIGEFARNLAEAVEPDVAVFAFLGRCIQLLMSKNKSKPRK